MLPRVRFPSRRSPHVALGALRHRPRPSRRLAVSSTLFPIAVLVALALAKGGPAEGQRAPVTASITVRPTSQIVWPGKPFDELNPETARRIAEEEATIIALRQGKKPTPGATPVQTYTTPIPTVRLADIPASALEPGEVKVNDGILGPMTQPIPPYSRGYGFTNGWRGDVGNVQILVAAGVSRVDVSEGVVVVLTSCGCPQSPDGLYPAPGQPGRLRITAVQGAIVTLADEHGGVLYFDLAQRSYASP